MTTKEPPKGYPTRSEERVVSGGRKAESIALAACVVLVAFHASAARAAFSFDDIEFWVGIGANRAALVIDWEEGATDPPALAWGYRSNGTAKGRDMLGAIIAADPRLYAKLGGTQANPIAVYGLGYDANDDGAFGLDDGTQFDAQGFAFSGPDDLGEATDPGDVYREGWFTGFWHYGVEAPTGANPYAGGSWSDIGIGMASRDLTDGSWDSWAFQHSTIPPFTVFAANPVAAPPPFPPGDFNQDGRVDVDDYGVWAGTFGSTSLLSADANHNGAVDTSDYVIWRDRIASSATGASTNSIGQVPEPAAALLLIGTVLLVQFAIPGQPRMNADERRFKNGNQSLSASIRGFFPAN